MTGTLTLEGASQGLVSGTKTIGPVTMTANATIGEILDVNLVTGDNTFTLPTGASAVALVLQSPPGVTLKVRTDLDVSGGGLTVGPSTVVGWWVGLPVPTGATELIINAAAAVGGLEISFI
jgi:hypothetical protein